MNIQLSEHFTYKKLRLYALIEDITIKGESCFEEK